MLCSCPYFRNEVGGEGERSVVLSRSTVCNNSTKASSDNVTKQGELPPTPNSTLLHMPVAARGFSLLDTLDTYWKNGYCPYRIHRLTGSRGGNRNVVSTQNIIERVDEGALFYKNFFYGQGEKCSTI